MSVASRRLFSIRRGFSLIEVLVGLAVFLLFSVGIYSSSQLVFKLIYQSRIRTLEAALLNEQMEIIRNLPYTDIGIVSSTPAGILSRTAELERNGLFFTLTRTIRNVDDPADGTIGGNPADAAPADYKFIELSVRCVGCSQEDPRMFTSTAAPPAIESGMESGALTVSVYDADGAPVAGASVRIVATSTIPAIDMTDITDSSGILNVVGLPPGAFAYAISAGKSGYTGDKTLIPTVSNPNPLKQPVSISAGQISAISFTIDELSSLSLSSVDVNCAAIPNAAFSLRGARLIGTEPDVYRVDEDATTDVGGQFVSSSMEWDTYSLFSAAFDVRGTIPAWPILASPGGSQTGTLVLGADTANSLLIHVRDRVSGLPISQATVMVTSTGYADQKSAGVGRVLQTAWDGGGGQAAMAIENKYWADDGNITANDPVGDLVLRTHGQSYVHDGQLESSTFDLGQPVEFVTLSWSPFSQLPDVGELGVQAQIATSNSSTPAVWEYRGPDGTAGTFYDPEHTDIHDSHNGKRYLRYKIFLQSEHPQSTAVLSDFSVSYTTSCTPPGQAYFGGLSAADHNVAVTAPGYQTVMETIPVSGDVYSVIEMVSE